VIYFNFAILQRGYYQGPREFPVEGSQRIRILHGRYVHLGKRGVKDMV